MAATPRAARRLLSRPDASAAAAHHRGLRPTGPSCTDHPQEPRPGAGRGGGAGLREAGVAGTETPAGDTST